MQSYILISKSFMAKRTTNILVRILVFIISKSLSWFVNVLCIKPRFNMSKTCSNLFKFLNCNNRIRIQHIRQFFILYRKIPLTILFSQENMSTYFLYFRLVNLLHSKAVSNLIDTYTFWFFKTKSNYISTHWLFNIPSSAKNIDILSVPEIINISDQSTQQNCGTLRILFSKSINYRIWLLYKQSVTLNIYYYITTKQTEAILFGVERSLNRFFKLPSKIKKFTVLRSVHVHKKSREQFQIKHYISGFKVANCPFHVNLNSIVLGIQFTAKVKIKEIASSCSFANEIL